MPDTRQAMGDTKAPLWLTRRFWLAAAAIVAALTLLAAVAPRASAYRALTDPGFGGHGRHGFGAHVLKDPAVAKEHAGMAVEWVVRRAACLRLRQPGTSMANHSLCSL